VKSTSCDEKGKGDLIRCLRRAFVACIVASELLWNLMLDAAIWVVEKGRMVVFVESALESIPRALGQSC
jgi:hypothetical protein